MGHYEVGILGAWAIALLAIAAIPALVLYARTRSDGARIRWSRAFLIFALAYLLWLDAAALVLFIGMQDGQPLRWLILPALIASVAYSSLLPWKRSSLREGAVGLGLLWLGCLLIPRVGWNVEKRFILDVQACLGQPAETVYAKLAYCDVKGPIENRGWVDENGVADEPWMMITHPKRSERTPGAKRGRERGCFLLLRNETVQEVAFHYD